MKHALASFALGLALGCASAPAKPGEAAPTPREVVDRFVAAERAGDLEGMRALAAAADRAAWTPEELARARAQTDAFGPPPAGVRHRVLSERVEGDQATVVVEVTRPRAGDLMRELLAVYERRSAKGGDLEAESTALLAEAMRSLRAKVKSGEVRLVPQQVTYRLAREPEGWRVRTGWAVVDELRARLAEARRLDEAGRAEEALRAYTEINRRLAELREDAPDGSVSEALSEWMAPTLKRLEEARASLERRAEAQQAADAEPKLRVDLEVARREIRCDESRCRVSRAYYQTLPHGLFTGARVVPAFAGGEVVGFKVFAVEGSAAELFGLESGDIVRRVNGVDLTSPVALLSLFESAPPDELVLELSRDGAEVVRILELGAAPSPEVAPAEAGSLPSEAPTGAEGS